MRILVTGAGGFVGSHLVADLQAAGHTAIELLFPESARGTNESYCVNITDAHALRDVVQQANPDACVHLAGIAFVPMGWSDPETVLGVNIGGTINLLEAIRQDAPSCRTLVVASSEIYGRDHGADSVTEDTPLRPANPYALSKMSADLMALLYAKRYELPIMTARPDNHIGPGQSRDFVISSFASQLESIARGASEPLMRVGNLESERDFTDVRDIARAYRLLVEKGRPGQAYNIASGKKISIQHALDLLCTIAEIQPKVEIDEGRYRPTDRTPTISTEKIAHDVGWKPEIDLSQTLRDVYEHIRDENTSASQA